MYTLLLLIFIALAGLSFFNSKDNYKKKYHHHQTWLERWKNKNKE